MVYIVLCRSKGIGHGLYCVEYIIRKFKTTFYTVLARKADGTIRIFQSLMGVKKPYGYLPYDPTKKQQSQEQQLGTGTLKVWDLGKNGWSTIIINNIEIIKGRRSVYVVSDPTIGPVVDLVEEIKKIQKIPPDAQQLSTPPVEEVPAEETIPLTTKEEIEKPVI